METVTVKLKTELDKNAQYFKQIVNKQKFKHNKVTIEIKSPLFNIVAIASRMREWKWNEEKFGEKTHADYNCPIAEKHNIFYLNCAELDIENVEFNKTDVPAMDIVLALQDIISVKLRNNDCNKKEIIEFTL